LNLNSDGHAGISKWAISAHKDLVSQNYYLWSRVFSNKLTPVYPRITPELFKQCMDTYKIIILSAALNLVLAKSWPTTLWPKILIFLACASVNPAKSIHPRILPTLLTLSISGYSHSAFLKWKSVLDPVTTTTCDNMKHDPRVVEPKFV